MKAPSCTASAAIKAACRAQHSASVHPLLSHQKRDCSLLPQLSKCPDEAKRGPISVNVKSLILQTHVSALCCCNLEQFHCSPMGQLVLSPAQHKQMTLKNWQAKILHSFHRTAIQAGALQVPVTAMPSHQMNISEGDQTTLSQQHLQAKPDNFPGL